MKRLILVVLPVLLLGCIRATDEVKTKSKAHTARVVAAESKVCEADKPALAVCVASAKDLDAEINKEGIDIAGGIEQGANVISEVAPVVASLPLPWAPIVGGGLLAATAIALAIAHGLKKKPVG